MAKRYLGAGGAVEKWSGSHQMLEAIRRIVEADGTKEIQSALQGAIHHLGFDSFLLVRRERAETVRGWEILMASEALGPLTADEQKAAVSLDEVFVGDRCIPIPRAMALPSAFGDAQALMRHLSRLGVTAVTSVYDGIYRRRDTLGLLVCGKGPANAQVQRARGAIPTLRIVLSTLSGFGSDRFRLDRPSLPKGELWVLSALAQGLSTKEIATKRGTSVRTIRAQLDSARQRLGARSTAHAIMIAMANDIVQDLSGASD